MTQLVLTPLRLENGIWLAHVAASAQPDLKVHYRDQVLEDVTLTEAPDGWHLHVPVPKTALSDGVHTFVVMDSSTSQKLADFSIIAGSPAENDLRAELDLLRAELDMLKLAFRHARNSET